MIMLKLNGYTRGEKKALLTSLGKLQNAICCEPYDCKTCPNKSLCHDLNNTWIFIAKELMKDENS